MADSKNGINLGTGSGKQAVAEVKEVKPTRYVILYRLEGEDVGLFRELLHPPKGNDPEQNPERVVIEARGQTEARKVFFEAITAEVPTPAYWPHEEAVAQVAVIPFSSWDPKAPRQRTLVAWE